MVRLRHAIWRRVLGTLIGVLRRRVERSGVKGHAFLVERGEGEIRSQYPDDRQAGIRQIILASSRYRSYLTAIMHEARVFERVFSGRNPIGWIAVLALAVQRARN